MTGDGPDASTATEASQSDKDSNDSASDTIHGGPHVFSPKSGTASPSF